MIFLGISEINYISKRTGKQVQGFNLYLGSEQGTICGVKPFRKFNHNGYASDIFVSKADFDRLDLGSFRFNDEVHPSFDIYGNLVSL